MAARVESPSPMAVGPLIPVARGSISVEEEGKGLHLPTPHKGSRSYCVSVANSPVASHLPSPFIVKLKDTVDHMASLPLEEVLKGCPGAQEQEEKKLSKPQPEQSLKCPRCESTNTKFCYYNNYSLSQPRYFCKGCRRYWTKGGSLRNVPVGGGCRKNRRSSSTSSSSSSKSKPQDQLQPFANPHPPLPPASSLLPPLLAYDPNELTLALARLQKQPHNPEPPYLVGNPNLDILGADHIPSGGFHNLYCGYKCEDVIQPFGADGFGGATATAATTVTTTTSQVSCKDAGVEGEDRTGMELQWPIGGDCIMGLESGARDHYWINGVGSNWQSLINSSLI